MSHGSSSAESGDGPVALGAIELKIREDRVAVISIDVVGAKVNTIGSGLLRELGIGLDRLERCGDVRGLVIRSGKAGQFVAGADLREIERLIGEARDRLAGFFDAGHSVFGRLTRLPFPTAALVDGACLGGGLELALACDLRVATNSARTRLGFPEVRVGLIPAWGGTQRLPRLIGVRRALEMIGGGEAVSAEDAHAVGLVDAVAAEEDALRECVRLVQEANDTGRWRGARREREGALGGYEHLSTAEVDATRRRLVDGLEEGRGARRAAIDVIVEGCRMGLAEGIERERQQALEVFRTPEALAAVGRFFRKL